MIPFMSNYPENVPSAAVVGLAAGIIVGVLAKNAIAFVFTTIVVGAIALSALNDKDK